jgi:hypothetical protein
VHVCRQQRHLVVEATTGACVEATTGACVEGAHTEAATNARVEAITSRSALFIRAKGRRVTGCSTDAFELMWAQNETMHTQRNASHLALETEVSACAVVNPTAHSRT